jgi:hypothetical protein
MLEHYERRNCQACNAPVYSQASYPDPEELFAYKTKDDYFICCRKDECRQIALLRILQEKVFKP